MNALFITHDCCIAGAQHSILRILRWFRAHTAWRIGVLALGDGPLAVEFARLAPFMEWRDLPNPATLPKKALARIAVLTGGIPDVIFGNTVLSAKAYELLSGFDSPMITRIAELDSSVDRYSSPDVQAALLRHSTGFVAVSTPVAEMLHLRFGVPNDRITVINGAIEDTKTTLDNSRRSALPMAPSNPNDTDDHKNATSLAYQPILWGCGSISHRKGADLFLCAAEALLARGATKFRAFWAGHPEDDLVRKLFLEKERSPARNHVTYLGQVSAPSLLMAPGDLFLMTSREDPFPLVSLEAAERGVPTVCFPNTGGIIDFVKKGGGIVAPETTAQAMTQCLIPLLADRNARIAAGEMARATVLQHYTMSQVGPLFADLFERMAAQTTPLVGNIASSSALAPSIHPLSATQSVSKMMANTTVVVRTVGERTTDACLHLLRQIFPKENVNVISEVPFSRAVRRCFEIGIEQSRKWTLVFDADVLIRAAFVTEILLFADRQQANTFVVQGLVHDKLFNLLRPAGNHLYRTKHLPLALSLIPEEGSTLRPEATTIDHMVEKGYLFIQKEFVAGLHDYEQQHEDIAKKCFVQAHKHSHFVQQVWPQWETKAKSDSDFHAAIIGAKLGQKHQGAVFIDHAFLKEQISSEEHIDDLKSKPPLQTDAFNDAVVIQTLTTALQAPDIEYMQSLMFPPQRWNYTYGKGNER